MVIDISTQQMIVTIILGAITCIGTVYGDSKTKYAHWFFIGGIAGILLICYWIYYLFRTTNQNQTNSSSDNPHISTTDFKEWSIFSSDKPSIFKTSENFCAATAFICLSPKSPKSSR